MATIYVLKCEKGKYYVGQTKKKVEERFAEHKNKQGSAWTRKYPPTEIVESFETKDEFQENNTTKKYMKKYGIENVRGGSYCQLVLDDFIIEALQRELLAADDKCYICGESGHFARDCPTCERCGRSNHKASSCYAKKHIVGYELGEEDGYELYEDECERCGRSNHVASSCYAKTYIDGSPIEEGFFSKVFKYFTK